MLEELAVISVWLTTSGMVQPFVLKRMVIHCPFGGHRVPNGSNGDYVVRPCEQSHLPIAIVLSVAGPFILPFFIGSTLTNKQGRIKNKQAKELAAANHKLELAKIESKQIKELESNLDGRL
jgi:hypothetical protein